MSTPHLGVEAVLGRAVAARVHHHPRLLVAGLADDAHLRAVRSQRLERFEVVLQLSLQNSTRLPFSPYFGEDCVNGRTDEVRGSRRSQTRHCDRRAQPYRVGDEIAPHGALLGVVPHANGLAGILLALDQRLPHLERRVLRPPPEHVPRVERVQHPIPRLVLHAIHVEDGGIALVRPDQQLVGKALVGDEVGRLDVVPGGQVPRHRPVARRGDGPQVKVLVALDVLRAARQ